MKRFVLILITLFIVSCASVTPVPTLPTPVLSPLAITPFNADKVVELSRLGTGTTYSISLSPDSKQVARASDLGIFFYDAQTLKEIRFLDTKKVAVQKVAISPDGKILAIGTKDKIVLIDTANGKELGSLSGTDTVYSVAFSPNGKTLATGLYQKVKLWDITNGKEVRTLSGGWIFSPDGKMVAGGASDNTVKLWDVASGKELITLSGHKASVNSLAFSSDGKTLASGSSDGTIRVWGVVTP